MAKQKVFKFYKDSGHGWLAVKRQLLEDLGLMRTITAFSYVKGKTFYLEEDQDLTVFKNAYEQRFGTLETETVDHGDRSWVRNLRSWGFINAAVDLTAPGVPASSVVTGTGIDGISVVDIAGTKTDF